MTEIELKSQTLRKSIQLQLGKKSEEPIIDVDLEKITSLKINSARISDFSIGDLVFFKNLKSLSLDGINITDKEIEILNKLPNITVLSISNAEISIENAKYLNDNINNMIFYNCAGVDISRLNENQSLRKLTAIDCSEMQLDGISQLKNLTEVNLANNEELTDEDIKDVWNIKNLESLNLDGDNNITNIERNDIEILKNQEYRPTERDLWDAPIQEEGIYSLGSIANLSNDRLKDIKGANIEVGAKDIEFLKTERGRELIEVLKANNRINLSLNNTAEIDMGSLDGLNDLCEFKKVYVRTGWSVTQAKGYSFDTYKAIKQEILNIINSIDPNLSEQEKYLAIRKRITETINYDNAALSATSGDFDYYASRNLENGLLNRTCVCAGYADIMKNVLAEVGIECKYVEGQSHYERDGVMCSESHAWNQVRLKGDDGNYYWYNDDVTWDTVGRGNMTYCLLTDSEFSKTHTAIPGRTEGNGTHTCTAIPPAAIRIAKKHRDTIQNKEEEGR